jgi:hypothetical protein
MSATDETTRWDARVQAWRVGTRDSQAVWVKPLMFTVAIVVGPPDDEWYADRWCYETRSQALAAATAWLASTEPEPTGWHRHPSTGRRRPGGDPASEFVER